MSRKALQQAYKRFAMNLLSFFLTLALPISGHSNQACHQVYRVKPNFVTTNQLLDETLGSLNQSLASSRKEKFSVSNLFRKVRSQTTIWILREVIKRAYLSSSNEIEFYEQMERQMNSLPKFLIEGLGVDKAQSLYKGLPDKLKSWKQTLHGYKDLSQDSYVQFRQDWDAMAVKYGAELFTPDGFRTALMNVFAMRAFARFTNAEKEPIKAINAMAALHPLVDTAIDQGLASKSSMKKIAAHLIGDLQFAETPFENAVLGLINDIYEIYPRAQHPRLVWLLARTFETELESARQKQGPYDSDTLRITVEKGAFSTSAFGYVGMGKMTESQFRFFYRSGTLFQLMDDFCDIKKDIDENVDTLFSHKLKSNEPIESSMKAIIDLYQSIERDVQSNTDRFDGQNEFMRFLKVSFHTQMLVGIAKLPENLRDNGLHVYSGLHPFSQRQIKKFGIRFLQLFQYQKHNEDRQFFHELKDFLFENHPMPDVEMLPPKYRDALDKYKEAG